MLASRTGWSGVAVRRLKCPRCAPGCTLTQVVPGLSADVIDRQLLVPSPMWHLFRSLDLAMPATDRLPGTLGSYRLQDRLGGGGMGGGPPPPGPPAGPVAVQASDPAT